MIRRVSSRQRIASWDIFDASSHSSNVATDEDYETCLSRISSMASLNASCHYTSSPFLGKRVRRVSMDLQSPHHMQHFMELVSDVQICIISFLSVEDAKKVMCTSKYMHHLIQNQTFLWKQWCFQQWPNLPRDAVFVDESDKCSNGSAHFNKGPFKFSVQKPSLRQSTLLKTSSIKSIEPNYSKLLKQRARDYPTFVDQSVPRVKITRPPIVFSVLAPTKIQFTGTVGTGDRCIRSDKPLAKPEQERRRHFLTFLCRGERKYKPFCSPFVGKNGTIHLTPRLVAYFEVTIMSPLPTTILHQTTPNDCVAIGLSRREFRTHGRMPGWDDLSYGYHGDDGGLFHNGGDMIRRFGPSFGAGDIVGCGVDYLHGGIFFTLNGQFLGYGWPQVDLDASFYPTIGVDTNSVLEANFGATSFLFDLVHFCEGKTGEQLQHMTR